jgi:hypothetical protein
MEDCVLSRKKAEIANKINYLAYKSVPVSRLSAGTAIARYG